MTEALPDKLAKLPEVRQKVSPDGNEHVEIVIDLSSEEERKGWIACLGTDDEATIRTLIEQIGMVSPVPEGKHVQYLKAHLAILQSIGPKDAAEALLSVQMLAVHQLLVRCTYRAVLSGQTDYGVEVNTARANGLARTYSMQMEALRAYRTKGEQRIKVQHVNVSDNAQAVIGDVKMGGRG